MINTNQLAEKLKVSPSSINKWRKTGDGPPYIRYGRKVMYRLEDVEQWLSERTFRGTFQERSMNR